MRKIHGMLLAVVMACALVLGWGMVSGVGRAYADGAGAEVGAAAGKAADGSQDARPPKGADAAEADIDEIMSKMTLDDKISQMIIVACRTWDGRDVTDLDEAPELALALRGHRFGGVILFGQNVKGNEQTARLVGQLQDNNQVQANNQIHGSYRPVPYFMAVDEEGGAVVRLSGGTRMTGSMAIGATGAASEKNARATGRLIGSEVAALGFNVNFAPSLDVNNNPANPVIGTRSFSDDPQAVATLGAAWIAGHAESGAIATLKHFPGHGDVDTDTHLGLVSVPKTYEQLNACELVPFRANADNADMIMTAHITLPAYDDEQTFADGTKGFYPATMSRKIITDLLRGDIGYDGVVVTDALEMGAIEALREAVGGASQVIQDGNIAEKVINAGCDMLLLPYDLKDADAARRYDDYISEIGSKVRTDQNPSGTIEVSRIDESVRRILALKKKYGLLEGVPATGDVASVGSEAHHELEMQIAREAVTLLKNEAHTLPVRSHNAKIVLVGTTADDNVALEHAVSELQGEGIIPEDAYVQNLVSGKTRGEAGSTTRVTIDYTYDVSDSANPRLHYTDKLREAIAEADLVAGIAKTRSLAALKKGEPQYEAIHQPLEDAHEAGAKFVFISDSLPYDVGRYQDADAILCAYMGSGTDIDPTTRRDGSATVGAFNANLVAAVEAMFGHTPPTGKIPVIIPAIDEAADGTLSYSTSETLYARGFGLCYADTVEPVQRIHRLAAVA